MGVNVKSTTTHPEAEEHVAVHPGNNQVVVGAISDFSQDGGFNTSKFATSSNGGGNWTEGFITKTPGNGPAVTWKAHSDPVVAISRKTGTAFLSTLMFCTASCDSSDTDGGLYAARSTDGGLSFPANQTYAVATHTAGVGTSQDFEDKNWITVDNNSASSFYGNVYHSWTRFFAAGRDAIYFSKSTNDGVSWSTPQRISQTALDGAVQGSGIATGPAGEIYVVFEVFFVGGKRQIYMTKSTNGGGTWTTAAAITPQFGELSSPFAGATYRTDSFPAIAVDNSGISGKNGNIYVVYASQSQGNADVSFIRSTNGGGTWSSPLRVNDVKTGQQFFPAIAVDSNGDIAIAWHDTRLADPKYDIFAARSDNNGTCFSTNQRVTSVSSTPPGASNSFIGDYGGIAGLGGNVYPVWSDTRNATATELATRRIVGDLFTAKLVK